MYAVSPWNLLHSDWKCAGSLPARDYSTTKCNREAILPINGPVCMTSVSQTEHSFGDGVFSFSLGKCASGCVPFSIMGVHNADSAESSLHTLLAYPTALLSSLISSVNASPRLIENELLYVSLQCLWKAVIEPHAPFLCRTDIRSLLLYAKNSLHSQINQYILECRGTIPGEAVYFHSMPKTEQLINQEYVEIKPHIKPEQSARLQWQWFTAGWAKLLTVRSCNGCQHLLLISVARDKYCCCYFLPRRFHWCLPK